MKCHEFIQVVLVQDAGSSLRKCMLHVSQDAVLKNGSVYAVMRLAKGSVQSEIKQTYLR